MNVPATETVATLRAAFARWGMPVHIRVDNGYPWGSTGDLPTELGLWLLGLSNSRPEVFPWKSRRFSSSTS